MHVAYVVLPSLLLLAGCATSGMGPDARGAEGQSMENCPMAASSAAGEQQHGAMMGDRAGQTMGQGQQTMGQGQMMQGMHQGAMSNCPMAQGATPAPAPDPHQH